MTKLETFILSTALKEYYTLVNQRLFYALKLFLFTVNFFPFPNFKDLSVKIPNMMGMGHIP